MKEKISDWWTNLVNVINISLRSLTYHSISLCVQLWSQNWTSNNGFLGIKKFWEATSRSQSRNRSFKPVWIRNMETDRGSKKTDKCFWDMVMMVVVLEGMTERKRGVGKTTHNVAWWHKRMERRGKIWTTEEKGWEDSRRTVKANLQIQVGTNDWSICGQHKKGDF